MKVALQLSDLLLRQLALNCCGVDSNGTDRHVYSVQGVERFVVLRLFACNHTLDRFASWSCCGRFAALLDSLGHNQVIWRNVATGHIRAQDRLINSIPGVKRLLCMLADLLCQGFSLGGYAVLFARLRETNSACIDPHLINRRCRLRKGWNCRHLLRGSR
ncbi:hypothetical protein IPC3_24955 [Pseudomonas aeruginosa]|nr:hypothetical protein IPC1038_23030 [Pseudomonas aeruginosa]RQJ37896.1 hypothetical protein IPC3_24955 [Pseudomonas aeruginosa]